MKVKERALMINRISWSAIHVPGQNTMKEQKVIQDIRHLVIYFWKALLQKRLAQRICTMKIWVATDKILVNRLLN